MRRDIARGGALAIVLATMIGCGESTEDMITTPDGRAGSPDAASTVDARPQAADARPAPDAAPAAPDAQLGPTATVVYLEEGRPRRDLAVIFYDADGFVTAETRTDGQGRATAPMRAGGAITLAVPSHITGMRELFTILGVQPGDVIPIDGGLYPDPKFATVGDAMVTVPGTVAGATLYGASIGSCSESRFSATGIAVRVTSNCVDPDTGKLKAFATAWRDASFGGYWYLAYGTAVAEPSATAAIAIPAWRTDWNEQTITVSGVPATAQTLSLRAGIHEPTFDYHHNLDIEPRLTTSPPSTVTAVARFPRDVARGSSLRFDVSYDDGVSWASMAALRVPTTSAVDLSRALLPRVRGLTVTSQGNGAALAWTAEGAMTRAQATVAVVYAGYRRWTVLAPASTTRSPLVLPRLPDSLADWRLPATGVEAELWFLGSDAFSGYDDVRNRMGVGIEARFMWPRAFSPAETVVSTMTLTRLP